MPGMLIPGDLERIALAQGYAIVTPEWLQENFQYSEGAKVRGPAGDFHIPSIVPRLTEDGCVFLKNDRCSIHEVSPFGCSRMDTHLSREEGDRRMVWALRVVARDILDDGLFQQAREVLVGANLAAPPLMLRRANFARLFDALPPADKQPLVIDSELSTT